MYREIRPYANSIWDDNNNNNKEQKKKYGVLSNFSTTVSYVICVVHWETVASTETI